MKPFSFRLRLISFFTLIAFATTSTSWCAEKVGAPLMAPGSDKSRPDISIPPNLGSIEESNNAPCPLLHAPCPMLFYIQDAHDSLEAQQNIAKIIHHLVQHEGVKTVFEEGYEGPVPTDEFFGFIQDAKIKEKISAFLLDKLRLGGAEYAHVNRKNVHSPQTIVLRKDKKQTALNYGLSTMDHGQSLEFTLLGADNLKLHRANIAAYRELAAHQDSILKNLNAIHSEIKKLAHHHFPKEMKDWMKLKERYEDDKLPLMDYIKRTQSIGHRAKGEGKMGKPYALTPLPYAARKFFQQINALENQIAHSFLQTPRDYQIFQHHKNLSFLKRLAEIKLSAEEYAATPGLLATMKTETLADFIFKESGKSLMLSKAWEREIRHAVRFYEIAKERDRTLEKTLQSWKFQVLSLKKNQNMSLKTSNIKLQTSNSNKAVLVFGGFHKNAITRILRKLGFSYAVITPKITRIEPRHQEYYKHLMSRGYHDFEKPFIAAQTKANSGSLSPHFLGAASHADRTPSILIEPFGHMEIRALYNVLLKNPGIPIEHLERHLRNNEQKLSGFSPRLLPQTVRDPHADHSKVADAALGRDFLERFYLPVWKAHRDKFFGALGEVHLRGLELIQKLSGIMRVPEFGFFLIGAKLGNFRFLGFFHKLSVLLIESFLNRLHVTSRDGIHQTFSPIPNNNKKIPSSSRTAVYQMTSSWTPQNQRPTFAGLFDLIRTYLMPDNMLNIVFIPLKITDPQHSFSPKEYLYIQSMSTPFSAIFYLDAAPLRRAKTLSNVLELSNNNLFLKQHTFSLPLHQRSEARTSLESHGTGSPYPIRKRWRYHKPIPDFLQSDSEETRALFASGTLTDLEATVLKHRLGLDGETPKTTKAVKRLLSVGYQTAVNGFKRAKEKAIAFHQRRKARAEMRSLQERSYGRWTDEEIAGGKPWMKWLDRWPTHKTHKSSRNEEDLQRFVHSLFIPSPRTAFQRPFWDLTMPSLLEGIGRLDFPEKGQPGEEAFQRIVDRMRREIWPEDLYGPFAARLAHESKEHYDEPKILKQNMHRLMQLPDVLEILFYRLLDLSEHLNLPHNIHRLEDGKYVDNAILIDLLPVYAAHLIDALEKNAPELEEEVTDRGFIAGFFQKLTKRKLYVYAFGKALEPFLYYDKEMQDAGLPPYRPQILKAFEDLRYPSTHEQVPIEKIMALYREVLDTPWWQYWLRYPSHFYGIPYSQGTHREYMRTIQLPSVYWPTMDWIHNLAAPLNLLEDLWLSLKSSVYSFILPVSRSAENFRRTLRRDLQELQRPNSLPSASKNPNDTGTPFSREGLRSELRAAAGRLKTARGTRPRDVVRLLSLSAGEPASVFVDYREVKKPRSELRENLFAMGYEVKRDPNTRLVIYGTNLMDESLKPFHDLGFHITADDLKNARSRFGQRSEYRNVLASANATLLKNNLGEAVVPFLLREPMEIYATLLFARSEARLNGITKQGDIYTVSAVLDSVLLDHWHDLVIRMAA